MIRNALVRRTARSTRKAVPVSVWQSVQWQIATFSGSTSAS